MDYFSKLSVSIKTRWKSSISRLRAYIKKLLFPLYFFPLKFVAYTAYYLVIFIFKLIRAFFGLIIDCIVYPFKSLKNALKSIFIIGVVIYFIASLFVITDYIRTHYGWFNKFICSVGVKDELHRKTVRIVGGYSEGSGFFVAPDQVITSFHVIADEPSPKIIFADGSFVTPTKITGNKDADLALLYVEKDYPDMVFPLPDIFLLNPDEPLISTGYPLGTDLVGKATSLTGNFIDFRKSKKDVVSYIQTNINLVEGMSGGPLTDQCGNIVGVNTTGLAGLSMYISSNFVKFLIPNFSDQAITKISVDPAKSPSEAVKAFYTYLKARKMKEGFDLLSTDYLKKTNFEEWTGRFTDVLDVNVIKTEPYQNSKDRVFIKFGMKNWIDNELEIHYYEGVWRTVPEDGVYKMLRSDISEVINPDMDWFYD